MPQNTKSIDKRTISLSYMDIFVKYRETKSFVNVQGHTPDTMHSSVRDPHTSCLLLAG